MTREHIIKTISKYLDAKPEEVNYALTRAFDENIGKNGTAFLQEAIGDHDLNELRTAKLVIEYFMKGEQCI